MNNRGKFAELKAVMYLQSKNYKIVEANYNCRFGEIDIIAKHHNYIVFVEVKSRENDSLVKPRELVDSKKQSKIIACAKYYLMTHEVDLQPRFDVIEIICKDLKIKSIEHLENAFQVV